MNLIVLYLSIVVIGYFVGTKLKKSGKSLSWTGKVQTGVIICLLFMMGSKIGSDEEVINSIGEIGISAIVLTVFALAGSVAASFGARKLMGITKEGGRKDD